MMLTQEMIIILVSDKKKSVHLHMYSDEIIIVILISLRLHRISNHSNNADNTEAQTTKADTIEASIIELDIIEADSTLHLNPKKRRIIQAENDSDEEYVELLSTTRRRRIIEMNSETEGAIEVFVIFTKREHILTELTCREIVNEPTASLLIFYRQHGLHQFFQIIQIQQDL